MQSRDSVLFGTAGIAIRYFKYRIPIPRNGIGDRYRMTRETGHSFPVFWYFFKTSHSVSVFRYCISVIQEKPVCAPAPGGVRSISEPFTAS